MKKTNKKKSILLILLLFSLFMIMGSSSGADITINSSTNFEQNIESAESGDTITLNSDVEYSSNSVGGIYLKDKNIIIKSSDKSKNAVINLNYRGSAFFISKGHLTLINITIKNGNSAIQNVGRFTAIGCTFSNNKVVIDSSGKVTLTSCTFNNNKGGNGGAIYNQGDITLKSCTFTNNKASDCGGAIYNDGKATLTLCTFTNNQAKYGGAIYSWSKITLNSCTFANNKAIMGGAIFNGRDPVIINGCTFSNNQAKKLGAAIYADRYPSCNCILTITKTTFKNNIITSKKIFNAISTESAKIIKKNVKITPRNGAKVPKQANLKITKVTKKANSHYVLVKNSGDKASVKSTLGVYIDKTLIKKVNVKALAIGKSLQVKVTIPKKYLSETHKNTIKTFKLAKSSFKAK